MRTLIASMLIFFVSFALSYETIQYCLKAFGDTSFVIPFDLPCAEQGPEPEESKDEKVYYSDDLYMHYKLITLHSLSGRLDPNNNINFSSSDYSQLVYSPPEQL